MAQDSLHKLELQISHLLRKGVLTAGLFLFVGWIWLLWNQGDVLQTFQTYQSLPLIETLHWAIVTNNKALVLGYAGLALLVALPIVRVFLTGFLFIRQKDYILAAMAYGVFFVLLASVMLGIEHS